MQRVVFFGALQQNDLVAVQLSLSTDKRKSLLTHFTCPDGLGQLFWEDFASFWGGLDPCPDGLGHFFLEMKCPRVSV